MNLGIIPAAGKAERWGGMMKELMPLGKGMALIDHSIEALMLSCNSILIVTSLEKLPSIAAHVDKYKADIPIWFTIQQYQGDIWGAVRSTFDWPADMYFFSMPDTIYNKNAFAYYPNYDFAMGLFKTDMPERFGVVLDRKIVNKRQLSEMETAPPYKAWGVLTWTYECVQFWRSITDDDEPSPTYTAMFNAAIRNFGCSHWEISGYYDFASHEDYLAYFMAKSKEKEMAKMSFELDGRKRP